MKPRNPIRVHAETWLTHAGFAILPRMSRAGIVRLSRFLGLCGYCFSRKLRTIGRVNLDIAFGGSKTDKEKAAILKKSFQSFSLVLLDAFWFSVKTDDRITRWVKFDPCFDVLFQPKAHICITAHYGNWEVLGMAVTWKGFPLHSVAKPLKNPEVDRMFIEARRKNGQTIVKREGAVRTLLRILQKGGKIALVLDQNTKLSEGGQFCEFFGLPVLVSSAVAGLALKTNSNIFVSFLSPQPDGSYLGDYGHEISIEPYRQLDQGAAITKLTTDITKELEQFLTKQPEHWLWTYKRWKFVPEGDDRSRFPFYARAAK